MTTIYKYYPIIRIWPAFRAQCPVVVHASVNDELPARGEPRYA